MDGRKCTNPTRLVWRTCDVSTCRFGWKGDRKVKRRTMGKVSAKKEGKGPLPLDEKMIQAMQEMGDTKGWDTRNDLRSLMEDEGVASSGSFEPTTAKEAIERGLDVYETKDYAGALAAFEQALNLPGTGVKRDKKKPAELSNGEKYSALYNIACCQAQLGEHRSGMMALAGCMEAGYEDYDNLRKDPDLEPLRQYPEFEGLIRKFEPQGLAKQFDPKQSALYRFFNRNK
mmetsp:Transcript_5786/g.35942  ORF Transcript_5786/g.35942 Transcript_5786/m.35942 type:complete len:229 (+) Transcript_5786:128-814(+)